MEKTLKMMRRSLREWNTATGEWRTFIDSIMDRMWDEGFPGDIVTVPGRLVVELRFDSVEHGRGNDLLPTLFNVLDELCVSVSETVGGCAFAGPSGSIVNVDIDQVDNPDCPSVTLVTESIEHHTFTKDSRRKLMSLVTTLRPGVTDGWKIKCDSFDDPVDPEIRVTVTATGSSPTVMIAQCSVEGQTAPTHIILAETDGNEDDAGSITDWHTLEDPFRVQLNVK